jgi:acetyl esterase
VLFATVPQPWSVGDRDAWVADHVDELGGLEGSIAVGGDSAGGNVAAVIAQIEREAGPRLAAQILIYPFLDLDLQHARRRYRSLTENAVGYYVTLDDLRWCVGNYLPVGADATDPRISPALHPDHSGLPAAVIAVAEYDPLRDQGTAYAAAVHGSSVPVTLHEGLGLIHGYCDMLTVVTSARFELDHVIESVSSTLATSVA